MFMMKSKNIYYFFSLSFLLFIFLLGLYVYSTGKLKSFLEENVIEEITSGSSCPNLLIRQGNVILLYNTNEPTVPGVNPKQFHSLDDYVRYYNQEKDSGVLCDILYLQQETTAQGRDVFRAYPNPGGNIGNGYVPPLGSLANPYPVKIDKGKPVKYDDAWIGDSSFNTGMYTGYDPQGQYVGRYTDLDQIHDSTQVLFPGGSPNAADPNWGGVLFTDEVVKSGFYDENNVTILTG